MTKYPGRMIRSSLFNSIGTDSKLFEQAAATPHYLLTLLVHARFSIDAPAFDITRGPVGSREAKIGQNRRMLHYWLDRLEDPFETFSMQQVTCSLGSLAVECEQGRFNRAGPSGTPPPKYYSVEDEHDIEVVEHLIGVAFVLGQATITQTVSLVKRLHQEANKPDWIASKKDDIMSMASPFHAASGLSKIAIVDAVADYYKHRDQWTDQDWTGPEIKNKTIRKAISLGLGPKGYHNMEFALRQLDVCLDDMSPLADLVVRWRSDLAHQIRVNVRANGIPMARGFWELDENGESQS
jgi:hypothetical protein